MSAKIKSISPGKAKLSGHSRIKGLHPVAKNAGFTALDFCIGAFVGGAVGSALGRWSLLAGAVTNFLGHHYEVHAVSSMGVGMMASGFQAKVPSAATNGVDGTEADLLGLKDAKERVLSFGKGFAQKMWLDKVVPSLKPAASVNGLGEVQYFVYPNETTVGELDISALERLEAQVKQSAQQYAAKQSPVTGIGDVDGLEGAIEERIY